MNAHDAERIVIEKSNDELLSMLAHPEACQPDILDAARAQLRKRGVELSVVNQQTDQEAVPPILTPGSGHSLTSFPVAALILLHYATCGVFSLIWLNLMHGKLPECDPTTR